MPSATLQELCQFMGGTIARGNPRTKINGIMSQCAQVKPGLLYFDVRGGRGGDRNIIQAVQNGAVGLVVSKYKRVLPSEVGANLVVISVPKVWEAFWQSVKYYRDQHHIPVVGVTGTSGKTTTKEMVTSILMRKWKVLKTIGNLNLPNFVPGHILRMQRGYNAAVFEIGMNRRGQISKQARVIRPNVGVITCIGPGHLENVGTMDDVIREKAGILEGIPDDGYLILNADDPNIAKIDLSGFKGKIIYFGLEKQADYMADNVVPGDQGTTFTLKGKNRHHKFYVPIVGHHNVGNALAAIAVARVFNIDFETIKIGLRRYRKPSMRLQIVKGIRNTTLINDTYNANPTSVAAGLGVLSQLAKGKTSIAVLGNMLEQGSFAAENHRRIGVEAAKLDIDWLITVGALAKEINKGAALNSRRMKIWSFLFRPQAVQFLKKHMPENAVVLVKGSRGAYMERIVRQLKEN